MGFQAGPGRVPGLLAAAGEDARGGRLGRWARVGLQDAAEGDEFSGHGMIEPVAGNARHWCRQHVLKKRVGGMVKPRARAVGGGAGEDVVHAELFDQVRGQAAEELAADPVARVGTGLVQGGGDAVLPQEDAGGQAGQSAANDFYVLWWHGGCHDTPRAGRGILARQPRRQRGVARMASNAQALNRVARQAIRQWPGARPSAAGNSLPRNPAWMLTRMSWRVIGWRPNG